MIFYAEDKGKDVTVSFDFCIGADGSYSNVRRQMMRVMRCVLYLEIRAVRSGIRIY